MSGYIWIYFLVTIIFTAITLALWWYFLAYRAARARGDCSSLSESCLDMWERFAMWFREKMQVGAARRLDKSTELE